MLLLLLLSCFSSVQLYVTPEMAAHQAPLALGFSRQEYWNWLPFPSPRDLPNPETEPVYPALAGAFFTAEPPRKPKRFFNSLYNEKLPLRPESPTSTYFVLLPPLILHIPIMCAFEV